MMVQPSVAAQRFHEIPGLYCCGDAVYTRLLSRTDLATCIQMLRGMLPHDVGGMAADCPQHGAAFHVRRWQKVACLIRWAGGMEAMQTLTHYHVVVSAACRKAITQKLHINMADAREESEIALNVSIQHVLDRTGLKPSQVPRL